MLYGSEIISWKIQICSYSGFNFI